MSSVLFILPCAGGSAASYDEWKKYVKCPVYAIEYAGHWQRYAESLYQNVDELLQDVLNQIQNNTEETDDIYILGHSMGGIIAWVVTKLLQYKYQRNVSGLFLAACYVPKSNKYKITFQDKKLKKLLKQSSGFSEKVLDSSFFKINLLPVFQRDFLLLKDLCEMFGTQDNILNMSITVLIGRRDSFVSKKDMLEWQIYTTQEVNCFEMSGNHVFLYDRENMQYICREIINTKVK